MPSTTNRRMRLSWLILSSILLVASITILWMDTTNASISSTNSIESTGGRSAVKIHQMVSIIQTTVSTQTLWSVIGNSYARSYPPGPPPFPVDDNPCHDGSSLKINDWAISDRYLTLNTSMLHVEPAPILYVGLCDDHQIEATSGPPSVIDPLGAYRDLEQLSPGVWAFRPVIDAPLGDYALRIPDHRIANVTIPVWLASNGRVFTTQHDDQNLVRRFTSLADVALSGDGFSPNDTVLATLVQIDSHERLAPLDAWEIPVNNDGSFVSAVPWSQPNRIEMHNQRGEFGVILCRAENCDMTPQFDYEPFFGASAGGVLNPISVSWPTLYSTAFCVNSAACAKPDIRVFINEKYDATASVSAPLGSDHAQAPIALTKDLRLEVQASDPLIGTQNGAGIQHVDFSITDESGLQVYSWRDGKAPFCLFDATLDCTPDLDSQPFSPGIYTVSAWVVTPDGYTFDALGTPMTISVENEQG